MLRKADGDRVMKQNQTFMWRKRSREGWKSVNDDDRSGRPSTSQTDDSLQKVCQVLDKDQRLKVRMIAEECGITKTIVHRILTGDLQMRKV
ncbi:HTH_48 domain-containing protein [Trichonephila clavata]|uniref:HTH_48 domain-containing protein n=1 Tax=Trichonephila clavata TaxID=2740835 RepID=A0A8X6HN61_TRICU|nr:HTH_48 domain-containing protein [Trichonephila clavata]